MTSLNLFDHVYNRCVGALWSQGYQAQDRYSEILSAAAAHSTGWSPEEIRQAARGALTQLGYALNPNATGDYDLLLPNPEPNRLWHEHTDPSVPRAGHAVRLTRRWAGAKEGDVGFLQGMFAKPQRGYTLGFGASVFQDDFHVTLSSGGPASILYLDTLKLRPTDEIVRMHRWRWRRGYASANQGAYFQVPVRVWEWDGSEADFIDWQEAEAAIEPLAA